MKSDTEKLNLIKQLVEDTKRGILNPESAFIALSLIVDEKKPSKECVEWAKNAIISLQ